MMIHTKKNWAAPTVTGVAHMSAAEAKQQQNSGEGVINVGGGVVITTGPGS